MKIRSFIILLAVLLSVGFSIQPSAAADESEITVLNPRGILPEIQRIPMAARPETLRFPQPPFVSGEIPVGRSANGGGPGYAPGIWRE